MKLEILVDTGEGEEEGGDNMEGEGGEETMVGEMVIEAILGLAGKMTLQMDKIGEVEALPTGKKIHLIKVLGVVEIIGMPRIHQVTSPGVAVEEQSHLVKINLLLGIVRRIANHL